MGHDIRPVLAGLGRDLRHRVPAVGPLRRVRWPGCCGPSWASARWWVPTASAGPASPARSCWVPSATRSLPCPGDWVVVRRWPDRRTTVEVVLPAERRWSAAGAAAGAGPGGEHGPRRGGRADAPGARRRLPRAVARARPRVGRRTGLVLTGSDAVRGSRPRSCAGSRTCPGYGCCAVGAAVGRRAGRAAGPGHRGHTLALLGRAARRRWWTPSRGRGDPRRPGAARAGTRGVRHWCRCPAAGAVLDIPGSGAAGCRARRGCLACRCRAGRRVPVGDRPAHRGRRARGPPPQLAAALTAPASAAGRERVRRGGRALTECPGACCGRGRATGARGSG